MFEFAKFTVVARADPAKKCVEDLPAEAQIERYAIKDCLAKQLAEEVKKLLMPAYLI